MMRNDQIKLLNTPAKTLFMLGNNMMAKRSGDEIAAYYEFLNCSTHVLNEFGIHIGTNGYSYLIEALKIIIDRERYDVRMKTDVYPLIAVKYGLKRYDPVEHSIRNAINTAYEDHLKQPGCNKMGMFPKKPTNKQFIIYAADEVIKKLCRNILNKLS